MGMRGGQPLRRGRAPLALPLILAGVRLAVVQATVMIAALVAGPAWGRIITSGFRRQDLPEVVSGALVVAVFALLLEGLMVLAQRLLDPVARARRTPALEPGRYADPSGCRTAPTDTRAVMTAGHRRRSA